MVVCAFGLHHKRHCSFLFALPPLWEQWLGESQRQWGEYTHPTLWRDPHGEKLGHPANSYKEGVQPQILQMATAPAHILITTQRDPVQQPSWEAVFQSLTYRNWQIMFVILIY